MYEIKLNKDKDQFYIGENETNFLAEAAFKHRDNGVIVLYHTFVDDSLRGQGIAKILVDKVVEYARENNLKIIPTCSYASKVLNKDASYDDVLKK